MSAEEASRIAQAVQRMRNSRRALQVALPTAALLGAGAAVAVGSVVGSDGTITGCYAGTTGATVTWPGTGTIGAAGTTGSTSTEPPGALRVIDPTVTISGEPAASACQPGEATISWNQKGPQGPVGSQGPAGPQGPAGESGLAGETTFGFSGASVDMFLKIDGIKGESMDSKHKGEIQVNSFQWGVGRGIAASGGGGGAGKTTIQSFSIMKVLDKSSPLLMSAAASGKYLKYAELLVTRKSGKEQDYLEIKMQGVLISGIQDGASSKGLPQEKVSFSFQKADEVFLNGNGRPGATVNLNFAANKAL